jgi:hypothetical protein
MRHVGFSFQLNIAMRLTPGVQPKPLWEVNTLKVNVRNTEWQIPLSVVDTGKKPVIFGVHIRQCLKH